jgi:3-hydroxybutyryl-CoA dehydrogenase
MTIDKIMVVGAGQMGGGIAQVAAQSGLRVVLHDREAEVVGQCLARVRRRLERAVEKGTITALEKEATLGRITVAATLAEAAGVDMVIEAVPERLQLKEEIFRSFDRLALPEAILASNTSSLSITLLAAATRRPERVVGMHFMNPVPVMPLVEIVRGLATADETVRTVAALAQRLGKTPVSVADSPGFVSNRLLMPMINEAICCLQEGVATTEAIDRVMTLGMNHPLGPLALADLIGLDTCLAVMEALHRDFADSKYRPSPLLRKMVAAGRLGKKSGRGFYLYGDRPAAEE